MAAALARLGVSMQDFERELNRAALEEAREDARARAAQFQSRLNQLVARHNAAGPPSSVRENARRMGAIEHLRWEIEKAHKDALRLTLELRGVEVPQCLQPMCWVRGTPPSIPHPE